jgi:hypothetical protein
MSASTKSIKKPKAFLKALGFDVLNMDTSGTLALAGDLITLMEPK